MKIWLDDLRPAPDGFVWCMSVNQAKRAIEEAERSSSVELIDCDHDLGDYAHDKRVLAWTKVNRLFYLIMFFRNVIIKL